VIKQIFRLLISGLILLCLTATIRAEEAGGKKTKSGYDNNPIFAGPTESASLLEEDDIVKTPVLRMPSFDKALKPWFDWKAGLKKKYDFELGLFYTSLFQSASDVPAGSDDSAASGIFRISGRWTLLKSKTGDTGILVANYDHRHSYGSPAPGDFGNYGYYGITGTLFSDAGGLLGDLNWQQSFAGRRGGIVVGRFDPNDYFDVLGYANPWTAFQNFYILNNASIALPDWSTGIAGGFWLNDQFYFKAGANDVNGVATEEKFRFDPDELYTTAEIGWASARDQMFFQNIHLTLWHADAKKNNLSEASDGVTIGANWTWESRWMVFVKAGWSDGSAPLFNESYTFGMLHYFAGRSDLLGLAVNWGDLSDGSLNDQTTTELFYRLQLAQNLALTPSLQYITDPALNPDEDKIWILGLRIRLTL
jgi:porin